MLCGVHPELTDLLFRSNECLRRLSRGDLTAASQLEELDSTLRELARRARDRPLERVGTIAALGDAEK
jgi:hypothetical protein